MDIYGPWMTGSAGSEVWCFAQRWPMGLDNSVAMPILSRAKICVRR